MAETSLTSASLVVTGNQHTNQPVNNNNNNNNKNPSTMDTEIIQWLKELNTFLDNLSLIPNTYWVDDKYP